MMNLVPDTINVSSILIDNSIINLATYFFKTIATSRSYLLNGHVKQYSNPRIEVPRDTATIVKTYIDFAVFLLCKAGFINLI